MCLWNSVEDEVVSHRICFATGVGRDVALVGPGPSRSTQQISVGLSSWPGVRAACPVCIQFHVVGLRAMDASEAEASKLESSTD